MKDVNVELGPVQETLLVPLLGRAMETRRKGLVNDPKAVEIVERLDYDFDKWRGGRSVVGATIRTRMFDEVVQRFLSKHPEGTIVELGCGLNTRFERLDNGRAHWFELDLPDTMTLRRRFFEDGPRRQMITGSVLDADWVARVAERGGPVCFVAEAVLIYFEAPEVQRVVGGLAARFSGAWLISDTTDSKTVDTQSEHDAMSKLSQQSWFRWKCDDPKALQSWGLQFVESKTFLDASADIMRAMPLMYRIMFRYLPFLVRSKVQGYRINLFELRPSGPSAVV